jgi:hypothetical protein
MDALSSAVAMKVNCDLQLTLMASKLYRLLGAKVGNGYTEAKADHIFRDLVDATVAVTVTDTEPEVRLSETPAQPRAPRRRLRKRRDPDPVDRRQEAPPDVWTMTDSSSRSTGVGIQSSDGDPLDGHAAGNGGYGQGDT